ncbi:MAG: Gfo/Idh/MocA family oxidoreductase, partial [Rhodothermaceae bacterium]|nr:Gfo/Idh/MocA family oxidoreductase [Rhodothermaceae bacterium]
MESNPSGKRFPLTRRQFVQSSAAATAGLMASGNFAFAKGSDAIKVGLIGCGGRGTGAAVQAMRSKQNVKLVAMSDAFKDRLDSSLENIMEELDDTSCIAVPEENKFVGFDGYKDVIAASDVIILTTPPGFRPMHFEAAIEAGKHVFMEKPVATDAPGIRQVLKTAKKAKEKQLNVVVGLQRHYQTVYREWVKRIHEGAIGDIVTSHVYWNSRGVWVRPRKEGQTEMEYQMRNWYYFNWLCGDHITEQHIHNIDVSNWVKKGYPVRAHGMGGRQVRNGKEHGEIFDHHFVEFEYADGSRMFSQCRHQEGCMNRVTEAFQGTNGFAPKPGVLKTSSGYTMWEHDDENDPNPYQVEHDELFAAVAAGEFKYADAKNGAMSTMTSILGRMATYSGQVIEWEDAINSDLSLMPKKFAWDAEPPILPNSDGYYPIAIPGKTKV